MTEETPPIAIESPETETSEREYFPLTFSREAALNAMGLKYGFVPPDKLREVDGFFRYDGDLGDTIKGLWICTIPNKSELPPIKTEDERRERADQWTVQRAERSPDDAYEEAQRWAQRELGLKDDKGPEFWACYLRFIVIMKDKNDSRFRVKVDAAPGASPEAPGEPDPNS